MEDSPAMKSDLAELRGELKSDLAELRSATKSDIAELRIEMMERMEKTETTLLREFRKWAVRFETPCAPIRSSSPASTSAWLRLKSV